MEGFRSYLPVLFYYKVFCFYEDLESYLKNAWYRVFDGCCGFFMFQRVL